MRETTDHTREILRKVRQVEIKSNRLVTDAMAGAYHSAFKGQGMDFEEVREYAPGDDIRSIDWNVTAKTGKPFIKKFREERELTIIVLLDLSASGEFGSKGQSKRQIASELASVLAFSAVRNNDKIGLLLYTDRVEKFVAPRKGRQHILRLIRDMLFHRPEGKKTDTVNALTYLNRVIKRHAIVFLLSDFLQDTQGEIPEYTQATAPLMKALALTNKRHDLVCISLKDEREQVLPSLGIITLEDAETGDIIEIDSSDQQLRKNYEIENKRRLNELEQGLRRAGIDHFAVSTQQSYMTALRSFFQTRRLRR